MSTATAEVLDMLSRQLIDVDEATRLLKAIKSSAGRRIRAALPPMIIGADDVLMESVGTAQKPQFGYGNFVMR